MKSLFTRLLPCFVVFALLPGCSEDDEDDLSLNGTNIAMADIAGNWTATRAIFGKSGEGPVMQVDVVADGGSVTLRIETNGDFSITVEAVGESAEVSMGRFRFDEDLLVIIFDDDPDDFEFFGITYNEPNLTIQGGIVFEAFDFNGDGTDEDADIDFAFVRS